MVSIIRKILLRFERHRETQFGDWYMWGSQKISRKRNNSSGYQTKQHYDRREWQSQTGGLWDRETCWVLDRISRKSGIPRSGTICLLQTNPESWYLGVGKSYRVNSIRMAISVETSLVTEFSHSHWNKVSRSSFKNHRTCPNNGRGKSTLNI